MNAKKLLRPAALVGLLIVIIGLFAYYIDKHPSIIKTLGHVSPWTLVVLLITYVILMLFWMGAYNATLNLCSERRLEPKENLLLSAYSTLANFFLPLQSGPGVRALYLKRRYKLPVTSYVFASLVYYGCYAVISAALLFLASSYWWAALPASVAAAGISLAVINFAKKRFQKKNKQLKLDLSRDRVIRLVAMTLGQIIIQAIIYGIELHSLHLSSNPLRVLSYTGAANFSLFVALTPGAIGFREAFLTFARGLHHYSTNSIIAANLIDRGTFLVFLGLLFIVVVATHARNKIKNMEL
jgi:uncharacterized membrane protein YbhN (UPF0104 family)